MRIIVAKRSGPGRARSGQGGWSIVELMATFSLVTVVSAVSLPSLADVMARYQLGAATRRVYAEIESLRAQAVTKNTRQRLTAVAGALHFEHLDPETGQWVDSGVVAPELAEVTVAMPGDIVFAPDGTAPSAGTVTVTDRASRQRNVVVSAAGLVRVAAP